MFPRTLSQGEGIWQWLFWMVEGFEAGASFSWGSFSGLATLVSRAIDWLQNFQPAGSLHASFIGCFSHSSPFIFISHLLLGNQKCLLEFILRLKDAMSVG